MRLANKKIKTVERRLHRIAVELIHFLRYKKTSVQVFLLPEKEMKILARRTGKLPKINKTKFGQELLSGEHLNVLSFRENNSFPSFEKEKSLGEVYINHDWAKGKIEVLVYLLIHGVLHLTGYTHDKKRDTIKMEKLEKKLWRHVLLSV